MSEGWLHRLLRREAEKRRIVAPEPRLPPKSTREVVAIDGAKGRGRWSAIACRIAGPSPYLPGSKEAYDWQCAEIDKALSEREREIARLRDALACCQEIGEKGTPPDYLSWLGALDKVAEIARAALSPTGESASQGTGETG